MDLCSKTIPCPRAIALGLGMVFVHKSTATVLLLLLSFHQVVVLLHVFPKVLILISLSLPVAPKKKRGDDKRRKHHQHSELILPERRKKPKTELQLEGAEGEPGVLEEGMSQHDKSILDRWKRIQQTTRPFVHPIRKLVKGSGAEGSTQFQEQLLKQQSDQIVQYQRKVAEQQKLIQEQQDQIKVLQEYQRVLVHECQTAAIKVPEFVAVATQATTVSTSQPLLLPKLEPPPIAQGVLSPPPPPSYSMPTKCTQSSVSPANVVTHPKGQVLVSHASVSRPNQAQSTLPCHQPQPYVSSSSRTAAVAPRSTVTNAVFSHHPPLVHVPTSSQFVLPSPLPVVALSHVNSTQPLPQLGSSIFSCTGALSSSTSPMVCNLNYSSSHASDFPSLRTSKPQNISVYSQCAPNTYEPFDEDLDSLLTIAGFPTGSGAGYGVGVVEDKLPESHPTIDLWYVFLY